MSEYSANDHLHNVTADIQQLTYQAQGVQDITGANVADYEEISPDAAASVTLSNARPGAPVSVMVNNLPRRNATGTGDASLENVRPIPAYTGAKIQQNQNVIVDVDFAENIYRGSYDVLTGKIVSDIIRVKVPSTGWEVSSGSETVFRNINKVPAWIGIDTTKRYCWGENIVAVFGGSPAANNPNKIVLRLDDTSELFYQPAEGITTADGVNQFFADNPRYIYYAVAEFQLDPVPPRRIYVDTPADVFTAESGTLTIKYQGIAPDEP